MKNNFIVHLCIAFLITGCSKEKEALLIQAETILPGKWNMESIQLPGYGLGITYLGHTFTTDTILFNVGSFEIFEFSTDTLHYSDAEHEKVNFILQIDDEQFPYGIRSLFMSGEELFAGFEHNGPPGIDTIDTPAEAFIWSSFIFSNNYFITILDNDHVELRKANDRDRNIITWRRLLTNGLVPSLSILTCLITFMNGTENKQE